MDLLPGFAVLTVVSLLVSLIWSDVKSSFTVFRTTEFYSPTHQSSWGSVFHNHSINLTRWSTWVDITLNNNSFAGFPSIQLTYGRIEVALIYTPTKSIEGDNEQKQSKRIRRSNGNWFRKKMRHWFAGTASQGSANQRSRSQSRGAELRSDWTLGLIWKMTVQVEATGRRHLLIT